MKKKIISISIFTLLIFTAFSATGIMSKQEINKKIDGRGGMFRQLPYDPDENGRDNWASDVAVEFIYYDDFSDVSNPICEIHWWGHSVFFNNNHFYDCDPEGMTFDITFYNDNESMPGDVVYSYDNVSPVITSTGIKYDWRPWPMCDIWELFYFKMELSPWCNMSDGWVSIVGTGSENDCIFANICSPYGNGIAYLDMAGDLSQQKDFAFMLTDEEETALEIDITGGFGGTIGITNSGDESLYDIPADIVIFGGLLRKISVHIRDTINLEPDDIASMDTGIFFGLGKIQIGVIADDVVEYHSGMQLLIYTLVQ